MAVEVETQFVAWDSVADRNVVRSTTVASIWDVIEFCCVNAGSSEDDEEEKDDAA